MIYIGVVLPRNGIRGLPAIESQPPRQLLDKIDDFLPSDLLFPVEIGLYYIDGASDNLPDRRDKIIIRYFDSVVFGTLSEKINRQLWDAI